MAKFELTDRIFAFCTKVAGGEYAYKAYLQHVATKKISEASAKASSSKLMTHPEVQDLIEKLKAERQDKLTEVNRELTTQAIKETMEVLPPEFFGLALTVENVDQLHYSIIKGMVEVEDVLPVKRKTYTKDGKLTEETVSFMRVKRKPNIRERQASMDALYKRWGSYAPGKHLHGFGKTGEDDDGEGNVQRFILLSDGTKIPFE